MNYKLNIMKGLKDNYLCQANMSWLESFSRNKFPYVFLLYSTVYVYLLAINKIIVGWKLNTFEFHLHSIQIQ